MSISLTQPSIGSTTSGPALNTNWQTIQDAINRSGADTADPIICESRLTLTTALPVTTSDVTGTTLYFTPYKGNRISLYDGTRWIMRTFSELSLTTSNISNGSSGSADTNYDIFAYDNSGSVAIEGLAWTNATTRATSLTTQNGVLVKSGTVTRRYIGTVRLNGSTQFSDTASRRFTWNYSNRVERALLVQETTAAWTYTTSTWRAANNSTANRVEFVRGISEDVVRATASVGVSASSTSNQAAAIGIGLDTTSANNADLYFGRCHTQGIQIKAHFLGFVSEGYHYLQWVEIGSTGGNTTTWQGSTTNLKSGILGLTYG